MRWVVVLAVARVVAQPTGLETLLAQECGCPEACDSPVLLNLSCQHNATWFYYENDTNTVQPDIFVDWMGVQPVFTMAPLILSAELPINCSAPNTDFSVFNLSNIVSYSQALQILDAVPLKQLSDMDCILDMPIPAVPPPADVYSLVLALSNILLPGNSTYLHLSYLPPSNVTLFELSAPFMVDDHISFMLTPAVHPMPPCCAQLPTALIVDLLTANGSAVLCLNIPALRIGQTNMFQLPLALGDCEYDAETIPGVQITYYYRVRLVSPPPCIVGPNVTFVAPDEFNATAVDLLTQSPTQAPTIGPTMVGPDFVGLAHDLDLINATHGPFCPEENSARAYCAGGRQPHAAITGTAFWNHSFVVSSIDSMAMAFPYPFDTSLPSVVFTQGPPNVTETTWQLDGETCNTIGSFVVQGKLLSVHDSASHSANVMAVHMPPIPDLHGCDATPGCVPGNETYYQSTIVAKTPAQWNTMSNEAVYEITLPQMSDTDLRLTIDFVRVSFRVNASFHLTQIINPSIRALIMNNSAYEDYPEYKDGHVCRYACGFLVNETAGRWNSLVPSDWMTQHCAFDAVFNKERFAFTPANWIFGTHANIPGTFTLDFFLKVRRCTGGEALPVNSITSESQIAGNQTACVAFTMETIHQVSDNVLILVAGVLGGVIGAALFGFSVWLCTTRINAKGAGAAETPIRQRQQQLALPGPSAGGGRAPTGTRGFNLMTAEEIRERMRKWS